MTTRAFRGAWLLVGLLTGCTQTFLQSNAAQTPPSAAVKLVPAVPGNVRLLSAAPDGRHVAYTTDVPDARLHVVWLGERDVAVADFAEGYGDLQWANNGQALLFQTVSAPNPAEPAFLPGGKVVTSRLQRYSLDTGVLDTLAESSEPVWFDAPSGANKVFWAFLGQFGKPGNLQEMDLATKVGKPVRVATTDRPQVSPDGTAIAWRDAQGEGVVVADLTTGRQRAIAGTENSDFTWLTADRLVAFSMSADQSGPRFTRFGRDGDRLSESVVSSGYMQPIASKARGGGIVSPDGTWLLGSSNGSSPPGTPIIHLETGKVVFAPSFAWRAWLDDHTLLGVYPDGVYTLPLSAIPGTTEAQAGAGDAR